MRPLTYDHGPASIEVRLSAGRVATIYDREIVFYIASLMAAKLEAGEDVRQDFVFTAHDLLSVTGPSREGGLVGPDLLQPPADARRPREIMATRRLAGRAQSHMQRPAAVPPCAPCADLGPIRMVEIQ